MSCASDCERGPEGGLHADLPEGYPYLIPDVIRLTAQNTCKDFVIILD
jgi:hypothetical protein